MPTFTTVRSSALPLLLLLCATSACTSAGGSGSSGSASSSSGTPVVTDSPTLPAAEGGAPAGCVTEVDAGVVDAGVEAGPADSASPVPELVTTIGSTGFVQIYNEGLIASFFEDDQIVHSPASPECVEHIRSGTKASSAAGDIVLSGENFGKDGGPPTLTVTPDETFQYLAFPERPLFLRESSMTVQFEKGGVVAFPAIDAVTLHSPPPGTIQITTPVLPPDGQAVIVKSDAPFEVRWPAPAAVPHQKMLVSLYFVTGPTRVGDIHCAFPLSDGVGAIPQRLLEDLKKRVGGTTGLGGRLRVLVGDQRAIEVSGASYVIELTAADSTNIIETPSELQ